MNAIKVYIKKVHEKRKVEKTTDEGEKYSYWLLIADTVDIGGEEKEKEIMFITKSDMEESIEKGYYLG